MDLEIKKESLSKIEEFTTLDDLKIKNIEGFVKLLLEQNGNFNFIGKSTIDKVWERHILDSAQLLKFIPNNNVKFADFGSGAGFPGLVLSILGVKDIHLIEKSYRKAEFLRQARSFSPNRVSVHQSKLEELSQLQFDCITSRALASLDKLLNYCQNFLKKDGYCLFLKGKNLTKEISSAKNGFSFDYELYPSLTSAESNIIKISNIKKLC